MKTATKPRVQRPMRLLPELDGDEFAALIHAAGYTLQQVSELAGRHKGYISGLRGRAYRVPMRYVQTLLDLAGERTFWSAYESLNADRNDDQYESDESADGRDDHDERQLRMPLHEA